MSTSRYNQTATLFTAGPLAGQVLVAGGCGTVWTPLASAELYNPRTGVWTPTSPMTAGRNYPAATLLATGQVLVAGGSEQRLLCAPRRVPDLRSEHRHVDAYRQYVHRA